MKADGHSACSGVEDALGNDYRHVIVDRIGRRQQRAGQKTPPPSSRVFYPIALSCVNGSVSLIHD
jgi:hypothetical protein